MNKKVNYKNDFRCNLCDKKYASASSLCNHNKKFHNDKNKKMNNTKIEIPFWANDPNIILNQKYIFEFEGLYKF